MRVFNSLVFATLMLLKQFSSSNSTSIPNSCFEPTGDCAWYQTCLNAHSNCTGNHYEYAISYGEKFCKLFTQNTEKFSPKGELWLENVRKCLQMALVPTIEQSNVDCKKIRDDAFGSHASCYVNSGLCELGFNDWWNIYKLIWTQFIPFYSGDFVESVKGAFQVGIGCISKIF